jgi:2-dehydro-3-deoxyphosphogalactonate aldolase
MNADFEEHFAGLPLMAILRGIAPTEVEVVAGTLLDEGIRLIEIPLNAPLALESIVRLAAYAGGGAVIGAGTVSSLREVDLVAEAGGALIVSPHCDPAIVRTSLESGMVPIAGFRTATEAFHALHAGARYLKFFPAAVENGQELKALTAVLPLDVRVLAVGGIDAMNAGTFRTHGAAGLGVGSSIYRPGKPVSEIREDARAIIESWIDGGR